jgi:hypothetical protein
VRPASWSFCGYSQACTDAARRSARIGVARATTTAEISPFDLLVRASACRRRPTQLRLVTGDDADNMCSPAAVPTTPANSIFVQRYDRNRFTHAWCSVDSGIAVSAVDDSCIACSCSDPLEPGACEESAYVPKKLRLTAHLSPVYL